MYEVTRECASSEVDFVSAELWEQGCSGIEEDELASGRVLLRAWFEVDDGAEWVKRAQDAWPPMEVGERLFLAPPWSDVPTPAGRLRLTIHPGMALGTGAHPLTQACLVAMERHVPAGDTVLDVGTGSGILCAAAHLLGAAVVIGCDIEFDSVRIAKENSTPALLFAGSTRALRSQCCDVLVANINETTHKLLKDEFARLTRRVTITP